MPDPFEVVIAIEINDDLSIPEDELTFTASRAGGPGGQHVNKTSTKITLHFDVQGSPSLTDTQRRKIARRLATRIGKDGCLRLRSQRHRSQAANKDETIERFVRLLASALERRRPRKKTKPSRAAKRRRLEDKRKRAGLKQTRSRQYTDD